MVAVAGTVMLKVFDSQLGLLKNAAPLAMIAPELGLDSIQTWAAIQASGLFGSISRTEAENVKVAPADTGTS